MRKHAVHEHKAFLITRLSCRFHCWLYLFALATNLGPTRFIANFRYADLASHSHRMCSPCIPILRNISEGFQLISFVSPNPLSEPCFSWTHARHAGFLFFGFSSGVAFAVGTLCEQLQERLHNCMNGIVFKIRICYRSNLRRWRLRTWIHWQAATALILPFHRSDHVFSIIGCLSIFCWHA